MAERAPEFLAGLIDAPMVSRDRLTRALVRARPDALVWCQSQGSGVTVSALTEALIASLPQALRLRWGEVLNRARRNPDLASRASVPARFVPSVDVFDGARPALSVALVVEVEIASWVVLSAHAGEESTVRLRLAINPPGVDAAFHELARDLVLPAAA